MKFMQLVAMLGAQSVNVDVRYAGAQPFWQQLTDFFPEPKDVSPLAEIYGTEMQIKYGDWDRNIDKRQALENHPMVIEAWEKAFSLRREEAEEQFCQQLIGLQEQQDLHPVGMSMNYMLTEDIFNIDNNKDIVNLQNAYFDDNTGDDYDQRMLDGDDEGPYPFPGYNGTRPNLRGN